MFKFLAQGAQWDNLIALSLPLVPGKVDLQLFSRKVKNLKNLLKKLEADFPSGSDIPLTFNAFFSQLYI